MHILRKYASNCTTFVVLKYLYLPPLLTGVFEQKYAKICIIITYVVLAYFCSKNR